MLGRNNMWETWQQIFTALGLYEILREVDDLVPFLQVLFFRHRYGRISFSVTAVRSHTL